MVDLAGIFPTADHRVRLRTTMAIYWDQAFVSADAQASPVRVTTLAPVAEFWNTGWAYQADLPELPDLALIPSSGPYKYDNASNGTLTVVRNEEWWGEPAATETLVFKTIADTEMVQALQNGEIDLFHPSNPTADMLAQLLARSAPGAATPARACS